MGLRSVPSGVGPGLHPLDLFRKSRLQHPGDRTAPDSRQSRLQRTLVCAQACLQGSLQRTLVCAQAFLCTLVHARASLQSCLHGTLVCARAFLQSCLHGTLVCARAFLQSRPPIYRKRRIDGPETSPTGEHDEDTEDVDTAPARQQRLPGAQIIDGKRTRETQGLPGAQITARKPKRGRPKRDPVPSASWLVEAGIRFRKSKTDSLLDICFADGVLSLPAITVDDTTECVFLNLMAFERLHVGAGNEITSYVFFMDVMVDSVKDVAVLSSKGIIHNAIGTDNAVAELFNSLGKYVSLDSGSGLRDVLWSVKEYYTRGWNMWRAKMLHFYFKSPWANSVAAFVFLLLLTLLQTVYTVLQYHTPSS